MQIWKSQLVNVAVFLVSAGVVIGCQSSDIPLSQKAGAEAASARGAEEAGEALSVLAKRHAKLVLEMSPEFATQLGVSADIAGEGFDKRLSEYSKEANASAYELAKSLRTELRSINRDALSGRDQVTYDVLDNAYEMAERQNEFSIGIPSVLGANPPYAVNQLFGPQIDLPRLFIAQHPVQSIDDARALIERLKSVSRVLDELADLAEVDAQKGVTPPTFALEAIAEAATRFTAPAPSEHAIATSFSSKLDRLSEIDEKVKQDLALTVNEMVKNDIYPAYKSFGARMTALIPAAGEGAGVWRLPNGADIYQVSLDAWGATGLTPDEIHQIGLDDVERIHRQMDKILVGVGYDKGPVGERMAALAKDPNYIIPNTDKAKEDLIGDLQDYVDEVLEIAPRWFASIPEHKMEVRRIPVHEQDSSSGGYYTPPSLDGARPGIFWINLKDSADSPVYTLKSLTYHEATPGHHFQASKALSITDLPLIQNMMWFGDYGEGWALYAEELAKEMGLYEGDELGDLGRLRMELYRATRLVVDTGLHHKRWSRETAIDYMVEVTGESRESISREIERYAVWPGQATSYKLGMIQFQRLRELAERELGEEFDLREFHEFVLQDGSMPMAVLAGRVDEWILEKKEK